MALAITNLGDDLPFGARVHGLNSKMLDEPDVRARLKTALEDRGILVCKDVEPSSRMQVALSEVFGPLKEHPVASVARANKKDLPGVIVISAGPEGCIVEIEGQPLVTWQPWHFDHAYNNELMYAAVLRPVKIASVGGDTLFADGIQIYKDMGPQFQTNAAGLNVIYNLDLRFDRQRFGLPPNFRLLKHHDKSVSAENEHARCAVHPAVWRRQDGQLVFHMCAYGCRGLEGDRSAEAFARLSEVWNEAERVMTPYRHRWEDGDMVVWDNLRVLHQACGTDPAESREVHRTTIKGDYGFGRWEAPGA